MGRGSPIFQPFIPDRRLFGRSSYTGLYNYLRYSPTRNRQLWLLPSLPYKLSQRPKSCFRSVPIWRRIQVDHPTFVSRLPKPASIQRTTQVSVSLKTSQSEDMDLILHSAGIGSSATIGRSNALSVIASIGPPLIVISSVTWPQSIHRKQAKSVTSVTIPTATEHWAVSGMDSLERTL